MKPKFAFKFLVKQDINKQTNKQDTKHFLFQLCSNNLSHFYFDMLYRFLKFIKNVQLFCTVLQGRVHFKFCSNGPGKPRTQKTHFLYYIFIQFLKTSKILTDYGVTDEWTKQLNNFGSQAMKISPLFFSLRGSKVVFFSF